MPRFEPGLDLADPAPGDEAIPLAVGGLPSPESTLAIHCVFEIVRRTRHQARLIPVNTGEDSQGLADATSHKPVVPIFDTPDNNARAALLAAQVPIVVVMGDFAETAHYCMVARDLDALAAARFVSQSFACLEPLRGQGGVRWVTVDKAARLAEWLDRVASWLGLQPATWQSVRQQMLADYAAWPTVEAAIHALVHCAEAASASWEQRPASTRVLFETLGKSYHPQATNSVFWPADCLLEPADPACPITGAMQMTGPARLLTFGPFLHLPPGAWQARYQFEVNDHPAGNLLEFDVVQGGKILVSRRVQVDEAGKFGFDSKFEIDEARQPVENRAILAEGAIGGYFRPTGIWLSRSE